MAAWQSISDQVERAPVKRGDASVTPIQRATLPAYSGDRIDRRGLTPQGSSSCSVPSATPRSMPYWADVPRAVRPRKIRTPSAAWPKYLGGSAGFRRGTGDPLGDGCPAGGHPQARRNVRQIVLVIRKENHDA
jgi:hypothetical protein